MMRQPGTGLSEATSHPWLVEPGSSIVRKGLALGAGFFVAGVTGEVVRHVVHWYSTDAFMLSVMALALVNFVALSWKKYEVLPAGVLIAWVLTLVTRPYDPTSIFTPLFLFGVVNSILLAAASLAFGAFPGPNLDPKQNLPPRKGQEMVRLERLARLRERQVQAAIDFAEVDYLRVVKIGVAALLPPLSIFVLLYTLSAPHFMAPGDLPMFLAMVGFAFYLNVLAYQFRRLFVIPAAFGFFFFTLTTLVSVAGSNLNLHTLSFAIAPFCLGLVNSGVFYVLARRFGLLETSSRRALKRRN